MTKRKRKISNQKSQQKPQKNREWRHQRTRIHTQLDNAFIEFMYVIENENIEADKSIETYLINTLYDPRMIEKVEREIKNDEKKINNLVLAMRSLANHLVKMKGIKQKKSIKVGDLEQAIQEVEIWPIPLLTQLENEEKD